MAERKWRGKRVLYIFDDTHRFWWFKIITDPNNSSKNAQYDVGLSIKNLYIKNGFRLQILLDLYLF